MRVIALSIAVLTLSVSSANAQWRHVRLTPQPGQPDAQQHPGALSREVHYGFQIFAMDAASWVALFGGTYIKYKWSRSGGELLERLGGGGAF